MRKSRLRNNPPWPKRSWDWVVAEAANFGLKNMEPNTAELEDKEEYTDFYLWLAVGKYSLQKYSMEDRAKIGEMARKIHLPPVYAFDTSWELSLRVTKTFIVVPFAWATLHPDVENPHDQIWQIFHDAIKALGIVLDNFEPIDATSTRGALLEYDDDAPPASAPTIAGNARSFIIDHEIDGRMYELRGIELYDLNQQHRLMKEQDLDFKGAIEIVKSVGPETYWGAALEKHGLVFPTRPNKYWLLVYPQRVGVRGTHDLSPPDWRNFPVTQETIFPLITDLDDGPVIRQLDLVDKPQKSQTNNDVRQFIPPTLVEDDGPFGGLEVAAAGIKGNISHQLADEAMQIGDIRIVTGPRTLEELSSALNQQLDRNLTWIVALNPYLINWKKYPVTAELLNIYDDGPTIPQLDLRDNPKRKR